MEVRFTDYAWKKINAYIQNCEQEISGLGRATVETDENETIIRVSDVFIWRQEVTGGTTEVHDNNDMFNLGSELVSAGVPMEELCVWWHSHAKMNAFFSGTDQTTIKEWVNNRFLVAVVGNHAGQFKATVAIKQPLPDVEQIQLGGVYAELGVKPKIEVEQLIEDVPVIYEEEPTDLELQVRQEIADKVTVRQHQIPSTTKKNKWDNWNPNTNYMGSENTEFRFPIYDKTMTSWAYPHKDAIVLGCGCKDCNRMRRTNDTTELPDSEPIDPQNFETVQQGFGFSGGFHGEEDGFMEQRAYLAADSCGCEDCREGMEEATASNTMTFVFDYKGHFFDKKNVRWQNRMPKKRKGAKPGQYAFAQ